MRRWIPVPLITADLFRRVVLSPDMQPRGRGFDSRSVTFPPPGFDILLHFKPLLWESIIRLRPPPPTCKAYPIALLLRDHCAIYAPLPTPPLYAIHHTILVMAISCKGQSESGCGRQNAYVCIYFISLTRRCTLIETKTLSPNTGTRANNTLQVTRLPHRGTC